MPDTTLHRREQVLAEAQRLFAEASIEAPVVAQSYMLTVEEARKSLIELREEVIKPAFPDVESSRGLLRKAMLDALLRQRPTSADEFRSLIPLKLREDTDSEQVGTAVR